MINVEYMNLIKTYRIDILNKKINQYDKEKIKIIMRIIFYEKFNNDNHENIDKKEKDYNIN